MSEIAGKPLHKFFIYAPDYTDEEALSRRLAVREKHLERARSLVDSTNLNVGGAMLTPESLEDGASKKMVGSMFIIAAESYEAAQKLIKSDIYYTSNVWDKEKLVITPFAPFRLPE